MKSIANLFVVVVLLLHSSFCYAQRHASASDDSYFTPREMVVFRDDFSQRNNNSYPVGWKIVPCKRTFSEINYKHWRIESDGNEKYVVAKSSLSHLTPNFSLEEYIADSFTLECDFFFSNYATAAQILITPEKHSDNYNSAYCCHRYAFVIFGLGSVYTSQIGIGKKSTDSDTMHCPHEDYPIPSLDTTIWHRMAISYHHRKMTLYIDNKKILTIPDWQYVPKYIYFGGSNVVKYKDISIATGTYVPPIKQLLKGLPLTTHNILFDAGSATIKSSSSTYLDELIKLLKENPRLQLNIYGHTDSIGDEEANMVLSEKRASAVREILIQKGVDGGRLYFKGFGESKPIQSGDSEVINALNRRVEFVPK
jgi:OOP family OmpA-OmpF porin